MPSVDENEEQLECSYFADGVYNVTAILENCSAMSNKVKQIYTLGLSNLTHRLIPRKNKYIYPQKRLA